MAFNQAQKEAIFHGTGPCQVLAGPGSGKTLTIVNRIRYLIENTDVRPEEILVVTFTRHAAAEMKNRLCSLMQRQEVPVTAGTFHGIFYAVLKWAYRIGSQNILSGKEKDQLLRMAASEYEEELCAGEDFLRELSEEIGKIKNNRLSPEEYESDLCGAQTFRRIYREYEKQRKSLKKLDFDDILVSCCELFLRRPDVLRQWQKKFRYILIDEFQDINRIQYDVIRMLALPENNLYVVGDDDQAIYGFRGAEPELMFRFSEDYPDAKRIILGTNYRSTGNIVANSLKVISHNKKRFSKELKTSAGRGNCVHVQELKDPAEQAEYIADEIAGRLDSGAAAEDIAVLFRVHTDIRPVADELVRRKMPISMKEYFPNLYEHFIAKDLFAYFRLASGDYARSDFLQVMNRPMRYIGRDSTAGKKNVFENVKDYYGDRDWMADRIGRFEWDLKMLAPMAPYAGIQYIRRKIGYDDFLKDYACTKKIDRAVLNDIVRELEESSRPFASFREWNRHAEEFGETLKNMRPEQETEGIRLMTLHAAKGLEFDTVFISDANEGTLPYRKAKTESQTEEERRLFYVGMTRARKTLQICYVRQKNGKVSEPSRFVAELLGERKPD